MPPSTPMGDLIDPEPAIQERLREELEPLRKGLADADSRWVRWQIRRRIARTERRVRREFGQAAW